MTGIDTIAETESQTHVVRRQWSTEAFNEATGNNCIHFGRNRATNEVMV